MSAARELVKRVAQESNPAPPARSREARDRKLQVMVTETELREVTDAAQRNGWSVAQWVRTAIYEKLGLIR